MRISRLYIKIFLSFLLAVFLSSMLIFIFTGLHSEHEHRQEMTRLVRAQVRLLQAYVELRQQQHPENNTEAGLQQAATELAELYSARIWFVRRSGNQQHTAKLESLFEPTDDFWKQRNASIDFSHMRVVADSGTEPLEKLDYRRHYALDRSAALFGHNGLVVFIMPYHTPEGAEYLMFAGRRIPPRPESDWPFFVAGFFLAFIILLYPASRILTRPLTELRAMAARFASGDLSARAKVRSRDEIGQLARSFNDMADRLERMIRSMRDLFAHVSHELRSPLARLRVSSEILAGNPSEPDRLRHMQTINSEIEILDELIGRVLDLSRLDIALGEATREVIAVDRIIKEYAERYSPIFTQKGIQCDVSESNTIKCRVKMVPESVHTIFTNLLDNAVKYAASGGAFQLSAEAHRNVLRICFQNSINPSTAGQLDPQKILEPFQRGPHATGNGSGLGLSIVQKIVIANGGDVHVSIDADEFQVTVQLPCL
ncbi:MAG: HAMP domain-containing histidine kinase [Leptospiraceae bacterium]|nr:HAMP domain-containing histidine kinase [Leptospiraceae bacterium]